MKKLHWIVTGVLLVSTIVLLFAYLRLQAHVRPLDVQVAERKAHPLLDDGLFTDNPKDIIINFSPLRADLNTYFQQNLPAESSFYFEYLPNGSTIRIDSNNELVAASLLKLPVVMDLYKAAELGRINLDKPIMIKKEWLDSGYGTLYQRGAGTSITARQAAELVLKNSDNTALRVLHATVNPALSDTEHALIELDVPFGITSGPQVITQAVIGAQPYTSLLKCLYLACFLTDDDSQEILSLMTQAPHLNRLGSVLPQSLPFAHKIGTFQQQTQGDCGIVYVPNRDYAICMIVNLPDQDAQIHFQKISKRVHDFVAIQ